MANKIIKFEKEGCSPCEMVQNLLESKDVNFEVINAFNEPSKAAKYDIGSVPTTVLINKEGKEIKRSVGFKPDELVDIINDL